MKIETSQEDNTKILPTTNYNKDNLTVSDGFRFGFGFGIGVFIWNVILVFSIIYIIFSFLGIGSPRGVTQSQSSKQYNTAPSANNMDEWLKINFPLP